MKVYLHYETESDEVENMTIKLSLPKSWRTGPMSQLLTLLVDSYNKKHKADAPEADKLDASKFHLETSSGQELASDAPVDKFIGNVDDLYLKDGSSKTMAELGIEVAQMDDNSNSKINTKKAAAKQTLPPTESELETAARAKAKESGNSDSDKSLPMCKRFGCQKRFNPEENGPTACRHHVKPPVFHETRKFWACCPDKIAWDWESFQQVPGCAVSEHTDVREGKSFMGGTDVRAELEKNGPQRIDTPTRQLSGLEKLSKLRKDLVSAGVKGSAFDSARDHLKDKVVSDKPDVAPAKIWDHVFEAIAGNITYGLENLPHD